MEYYRALYLTLISANGLKNTSLTGKMDVFAVASISGSHQKLTTSVNKGGGSNPTWNSAMKFTVNEAAAMQSDALLIKIKAAGWFMDTELGQVHVPIKDLMEGVNTHQEKSISFPVIRKWSGKPNGSITFSYKFGEKFSGKPPPVKISWPVASTSSHLHHQRRVNKNNRSMAKQLPKKNKSDTGMGLAGGVSVMAISAGGGGCGCGGGGGCGGGSGCGGC